MYHECAHHSVVGILLSLLDNGLSNAIGDGMPTAVTLQWLLSCLLDGNGQLPLQPKCFWQIQYMPHASSHLYI